MGQRVLSADRSCAWSRSRAVVACQLAPLAGHSWSRTYATDRVGMFGLTLTLAVEIGKQGVRCNAVAPGFSDTEMTQRYRDEPGNAAWIAGRHAGGSRPIPVSARA